jgi:transcriptional regulator with XRE-family HTH domain
MRQAVQTREALRLLGKIIEAGRKQKGWSEQELASRAGISRNTVRKAQRGEPTVSAGALFECAYLAGVDLLGDRHTRRQEALRIQGVLDLLPKRVHSDDGGRGADF